MTARFAQTSHAARLTVDVAGIPLEGTPRVEIRTWGLSLVGRVAAGEEAVLDPGRYIVRVVRPDGSEDAQTIDLDALTREHILLASEPPLLARGGIQEIALGLTSTLVVPATHPAEEAFALEDPRDDQEVWFLRVVSGADGRPVEIESPISRSARLLPPPGRTSVVLTLELPSERPGPFFAQVARNRLVPVNVGLPGVPGHPVALHVVIDETNGGVSASAAPTRDVDDGVEALVAYLAGGWIREAVEIALGPVRRRGVVGATLSNLTLLRAGHHDAVDSRFEPSPDLPDSFVVAAEAAVRRGDSGGAVGWLTEALGRGLPVFGDALAILARRVDRHDTGIPEEWIDRTLAASERADLSTVMTTFAAAEPLDAAHSERPAEDFVGWIEYRGALEGGQLMPA